MPCPKYFEIRLADTRSLMLQSGIRLSRSCSRLWRCSIVHRWSAKISNEIGRLHRIRWSNVLQVLLPVHVNLAVSISKVGSRLGTYSDTGVSPKFII